jgi:hypothetical protein
MKKLLDIYGYIFPLHFTPFNGTNKYAFAKSINLSKKFQDLNFSLFVKNSGIIPVVNELSILAEKYRRSVTELKIAGMNRREILQYNHSGSKDTLRLIKTHLSNFPIPVISIPEYKSNNSIPGTMSSIKNIYQNTF